MSEFDDAVKATLEFIEQDARIRGDVTAIAVGALEKIANSTSEQASSLRATANAALNSNCRASHEMKRHPKGNYMSEIARVWVFGLGGVVAGCCVGALIAWWMGERLKRDLKRMADEE